ncbi:MAG: deoxyribose-phosphate aldolase [Gammaproteobacteria bacterium]|nr:deoxyribose-phosphate aldolase [Gammaproteobacteria bacterium]
MDWNSKIAGYHDIADESPWTLQDLKLLLSVIDLTNLNLQETEESIAKLCQKADSSLGCVAAICVYPKFVPLVAELAPKINIAAVANFPTGDEKLSDVLKQIQNAIESGAKEIDVVFPFSTYFKDGKTDALEFVKQCKKTCGKKLLKVILEISEFASSDQIYTVSNEVIDCGANFLKTSTGKSKHGATLESASVMLLAIHSQEKRAAGFKASGGIKEIKQALAYVKLAKKIMGDEWLDPTHFRIGASHLIDNIFISASDLEN